MIWKKRKTQIMTNEGEMEEENLNNSQFEEESQDKPCSRLQGNNRPCPNNCPTLSKISTDKNKKCPTRGILSKGTPVKVFAVESGPSSYDYNNELSFDNTESGLSSNDTVSGAEDDNHEKEQGSSPSAPKPCPSQSLSHKKRASIV